MSREVVLKVIAEVSKSAEELIATIEAAMRSLAGPEKAAAEEARPYTLQADLNSAQAVVFAANGITAEELEFSFTYYNSGPGRDRKIIDAASAVRKMLGKHL